MIRVTVRDDGHGFDTLAHSDGFGLVGIRERVELLDGSLDVTSSPGRGTTITATFPASDTERVREQLAGATPPDHT